MIHPYILGAIATLTFAYLLVRNDATLRMRLKFIDDDNLYPDMYDKLPSYHVMVFGIQHQFRWTKAQWIKYTRKQA